MIRTSRDLALDVVAWVGVVVVGVSWVGLIISGIIVIVRSL